MKLKTFIDRPILSCAISVLILILGVIGLSNLPMEQYPDIAPPTIMVSTTYTGANAETVLKSVIAPLEEAINGVENMTYMTSTATLTRFNMYTSIPVNGMPADGYSSGDAIAAIEEVASQTLPTGYGYEFSGITREESSSTGNTVIIFIICIVFIYLILCSLYESIFIPMVVILAVPFGLMGSFLFAKCFGLENNIYMQTGLIMLIGLLSKTAILLTEYASARRRQGMSIAQAAVAAAGVRLRPILMTALTMIIGLFPLIVATGAGANGNRSLGVGTVGGMLVGTVALLFVVPVLFTVFQAIEERVMPRRQTDAAE